MIFLLRCLGRKAWCSRAPTAAAAAATYSLMLIAKLNEVEPRAWLVDVPARIARSSGRRLDELLPWHWPCHSEDGSLAA